MSQPCFVYVITIEGQDLCKIGISNNPNGRIAQLLTGSPFQMELVFAFRVESRDDARTLERAFHSYLEEHRSRGEWFHLSPEDAVFLMSINLAAFLRRKKRLEGCQLAAALMCAGAPRGTFESYHSLLGEPVQ
jgi:hypothetical protein